MKKLMFAATLALAPLAAAHAVPADVGAAVSAPGRPAEATALDAARHPAEVLRFLGLQRGARALDLYTDNGYYGEIMARAVGPRGVVTGWNPREFQGNGTDVAQAATRQRTPNFVTLITPAQAFTLPAGAFDSAIVHLNYHDTYYENARVGYRMDPEHFVRTVFQSLKPGGAIVVVDHVAAPGGDDTKTVVNRLHRIDPAAVRADFERAGFVFDGELNVLRNPADDHTKGVFDPTIRGRTDRFVYRFRRPR